MCVVPDDLSKLLWALWFCYVPGLSECPEKQILFMVDNYPWSKPGHLWHALSEGIGDWVAIFTYKV